MPGSRRHDAFVHIQGMTPDELRDGARALAISYAFHDSPFGTLLAASTPRGLCSLAFEDRQAGVPESLARLFPRGRFERRVDDFQRDATAILRADQGRQPDRVRLHLKGTAFQLETWRALLRVPRGRLTTYGALARSLGKPGAGRAVGAAVGRNPVAYLIPCHRVIRASGDLGGYRWQPARKAAIVEWEASAEAQHAQR